MDAKYKIEISIIVPVYKGIKFLRAALESVKAQTFTDWECICVDDGAKDGSGELADKIAREDDRIRVIHQPNGGTSVARNTGMAAARGKYLAFLDEDDLYHPCYLERLYTAAEEYQADITACEMVKFAEDATPEFSGAEDVQWQLADADGIRELLSHWYEGIPFEIWRSLYRTDVFAKCRFPEGVRVEQDLQWLYLNIFKCRKYVHTKWQGYWWRQSSIGGFLNPDVESCISLMRTYYEILERYDSELGFTQAQFDEFKLRMEYNIDRNVRVPMLGSMKYTREKLREFRKAAFALREYGVDVCHVLRLKKRMLWRLFLFLGWR